MALLHGAAEIAPEAGWRLSVGHVHHGWRGREADRDLAFVAEHAPPAGTPSSRCAATPGPRRGSSASPPRPARATSATRRCSRWRARRGADAHRDRPPGRRRASSRTSSRRSAAGGSPRLAGPRESRADGVVRPLLGVAGAEILRFLAGARNRLPPRRVQRQSAALAQPRAPRARRASLDAPAGPTPCAHWCRDRTPARRERLELEGASTSPRPRPSSARDRTASP